MATQKISQELAEKKIKQMEAIYQDFLNKIKKIEQVRDDKISAIIKKADERQMEKIRQEFK